MEGKFNRKLIGGETMPNNSKEVADFIARLGMMIAAGTDLSTLQYHTLQAVNQMNMTGIEKMLFISMVNKTLKSMGVSGEIKV